MKASERQPCKWSEGGACQCALEQQSKGDLYGRVWMHCEEGLNYSKASMSRFVMYCLGNNVEIGDIWVLNPNFPRSAVSVSVRIKPDQFAEFEKETGGKLRKPPQISLN